MRVLLLTPDQFGAPRCGTVTPSDVVPAECADPVADVFVEDIGPAGAHREGTQRRDGRDYEEGRPHPLLAVAAAELSCPRAFPSAKTIALQRHKGYERVRALVDRTRRIRSPRPHHRANGRTMGRADERDP
jgi:hypothetical protein